MILTAVLTACRPAPPDPPASGGWEPYDPYGYADPRIATGGFGAQVTGINPGAAWPLGMVLVGPDTRDTVTGALPFYHYGGYHWADDRIDGFSHTHGHGMGIVDFGAVHVMPRAEWSDRYTTGEGRAAPFVHEEEEAAPGWYAVTLGDDGTRVEIAATAHGAHHRYTFEPGHRPVVILDLGHTLPTVTTGPDSEVTLLPDGRIVGFQRISGGYSGRFGGITTWFEGQLDPAPVATGGWTDPADPGPGDRASGATAGVWAAFPEGTLAVDLRLALSIVDAAGAAANLAAELPSGPVEDRRAESRAAWTEVLSVARVWGGSDETTTRRVFHSAAYRTALMPREYRDVDGRYRGLDQQVHTADFRYLSDLSLWDTYRTTHPWFALALPEVQRDVARSLVRMAEDGGSLPRWPMAHGYTGGMVGSPASIVLADTALKGLGDGWDTAAALDFVVAQSDGPTPPEGRDHVEDWVSLGYVPDDVGGSVSLTLEYAWADFAGAGFAELLSRDAEAERLRARSSGWEAVWDDAVGFAHGRARDGTFGALEAPEVWTDDYVEGNAWHYLWQVPYDVEGMIAVQHGGSVDAFAERYAGYWDAVRAEPENDFPDDYYWHGNEPVMHYAWLGSLAGRADLSIDAVDWVVHHRYGDGPTGLDGNDDAGTLSAWYLFAALGLYPIAGTPTYALAVPQVEHAEVATVGGTLSIDAPGAADGVYVPAAISVNGVPLSGATVSHGDLLGSTLVFEP